MTTKRALVGLYVLVALAHRVGLGVPVGWLALATKPLLMPILLAYVVVSTRRGRRPAALLVGLAFGWAGDVVLQTSLSVAFLVGLGLFLAGHVGYIVGFVRLHALAGLRRRALLAVPYAVAYVALTVALWPRLGTTRVPMAGYGLVLFAMALLAMALDWRLGVGALLFVCSDLLLGATHVGISFPAADLVVMSTYAAAQLVIVLRWLGLTAAGESG